jgi:phosphatidate phosphatase APP1
MVGVWQLSMIEFSDSYTVRGVILCKPLADINIINSWFNSARYVVRTYFCKPLVHEEILVNRQFTIRTSKDGSFELKIDKSDASKDFQISYNNRVLPIIQKYPVLFNEDDAQMVVISDIDETILQSFTSKAFKRMTTTLFKSVSQRKTIDFTQSLYAFLEKRKARFFYVSKSESNLFQIISGVIINNKLPTGAIFLTGYLSLMGLLKNKKEKNFKLKQIDKIIMHLPDKKFVLIGDDSQNDPIIYASIANKYKYQIIAVYIRKTRSKIAQVKNPDRYFIDNTEVPLITYKHNQQFSELIVTNQGNLY